MQRSILIGLISLMVSPFLLGMSKEIVYEIQASYDPSGSMMCGISFKKLTEPKTELWWDGEVETHLTKKIFAAGCDQPSWEKTMDVRRYNNNFDMYHNLKAVFKNLTLMEKCNYQKLYFDAECNLVSSNSGVKKGLIMQLFSKDQFYNVEVDKNFAQAAPSLLKSLKEVLDNTTKY